MFEIELLQYLFDVIKLELKETNIYYLIMSENRCLALSIHFVARSPCNFYISKPF